MIDAAQAVQNWVNGIRSSTEKSRKKIQAMTEAPGQAAARQAPFWQSQVSSPEALQRYTANVGAVTLQQWQSAMLGKGLARQAQGAADAQNKMLAHLQSFLPHVEAVAQQVRSMPKGGIENSIARMVAQVRGNAAYRRR